jgi:hypothetical protein
MMLSSDSPKTHRFISIFERQYIISETRNFKEDISESTEQSVNSNIKTKKNTPWVKILKSKACLAIFVRYLKNYLGIISFK